MRGSHRIKAPMSRKKSGRVMDAEEEYKLLKRKYDELLQVWCIE
jgi:hypothetical protein